MPSLSTTKPRRIWRTPFVRGLSYAIPLSVALWAGMIVLAIEVTR